MEQQIGGVGYRVHLPTRSFHGSALTPDSRGVSGILQELSGWWEPTPSTGTVTQRAYQSGGYADQAFYQARVLVLKVVFHGRDRVAVTDAFEDFLGSLSINDLFPLVVEEDGVLRHAMVRMEGTPLVKWRGGLSAYVDVQLVAPKWRRFSGDGSAPTYSQTVGLPRTEGGRRRPYRLPSAINATVISGSVDVVNMGNAPASVVVTFAGPVSRPSVRTLGGQSLTFDLDVLAGQSLVVDLDAHTVKLNGVSRRGTMRGNWLELTPGNNTLTFDAASYDEAARMTVSWSDSWK